MKLLHINRDIILIEGGGRIKPTYEELYQRVDQLESELYEANVKIEEVKAKYYWIGFWAGLLTFIASTLIT